MLNQPLLDKILASKGRQAEEKATVYSRVHIAGQSQKAYTIKHRAVHGWDFDHLRDIGVLTKENVEYGNDIRLSTCMYARPWSYFKARVYITRAYLEA